MKLQALGRIGAQAAGITCSSSTNTTPIVLTLGAGHGLKDGDRIAVRGITGNTNANGIWTLASVGATAATLVGSRGNGSHGGTAAVAVVCDKTPFMRGHSAVAAVLNATGVALADATVAIEGSNQSDEEWQSAASYATAEKGVAIGAVGGTTDGCWELREVELHRYMRLNCSAYTAGGVSAWLLA